MSRIAKITAQQRRINHEKRSGSQTLFISHAGAEKVKNGGTV